MLDSGMAGKTKLNDQHLVGFSNDGRTAVRKEDQVTAGSSLLNFMNLASGNVKTALEKPANFKRNINHRRYLQKQLRNYSKRKNDITGPKKPKDVLKHKAHTLAGDKHGMSRNSSRQEGSSKRTVDVTNFEKPAALRERNLPPSFWQEPVLQDGSETYMYSLYPLHARAGESEDPYNPAFETYFEGWNECVAREIPVEELSQSGSVPSVSSDEAICDDFMTGEELTRSIDIKDLYVPELYITDRSPHESSQGESLYLAPISPTQYVLTPTSCTDQAYFNFSFDHDPSGLPPFAMAFLSPGSLTQY
ncbi:hypothetical protein OS493_013183 [Desmophyllum pertusum]|uniref:Uncharacterized protein n=1 Tax=Desmophyllum pertusum TaxID=174260 RepID=A0A9X0CKS1_9CNID|nr:hypothetical protein OS493_013183 [Desmophyllum pertusum]